MEHAGRVIRASSPRAFGRLWPSWSTPGRKPERRAPERSVGSLVALMEHAGEETRTSSPRAFGRLACGSHGARQKGDPSVELPSVRSARLWLSWSTPGRKPERQAPERSVGSFRAHRCMGDFYPIFEQVDYRVITWRSIIEVEGCRCVSHHAGSG